MNESQAFSAAVAQLKLDEGFSGEVYQCPTGYDTVGYGARMPLTPAEGEMILRYRLQRMWKQFRHNFAAKYEDAEDIHLAPSHVQQALLNMIYQLGVGGVLKFRNMLRCVAAGEYAAASSEALDSLWARQTPARAHRVARLLRGEKHV